MAKVIRDKQTRKSLGYGFVKYMAKESAEEAIRKKNGLMMGMKTIKVSFARPPSDDIKNCKLYVTNLPREFGEGEVADLFQQVSVVSILQLQNVVLTFCDPFSSEKSLNAECCATQIRRSIEELHSFNTM
jgi:RNA recognition motif-containing protein